MKRLLSWFLLLSIIFSLSACELDIDSTISAADPNIIKCQQSSSSLIGLHYEEVIKKLSDAGFTNIKTEVLYDIITGWLTSDGEVESISIGGDTSFSKGDEFSKDAEVIVTYHTWVSNEPSDETTPSVPEGSVAVPGASYSYSGENYQDVINELKAAGFTNIRTEILYDIITGWLTSDGDVETVSIDGQTSFKKGDIFNNDAEIVVTYHTWESNSPDKITLTMNASDFIGMDKSEAETKLREMGFTSFDYNTTATYDKTKENLILSVEIVDWFVDYDDFKTGDKFDPDVTVTLHYYEFKEPTKPSPVYYSTNDYETATKGNTGVFSYIDRGSVYDIYWIIDFDSGFVYYFTHGEGATYCDRLRIESGDLNSRVTITYYDGGIAWSNYLYFKDQHAPTKLIMTDQNGFNWEYSPTDLDYALSLLATKTITDKSKPNEPSTDTTGLEYTINSDGKTCTIVGIGICEDANIEIPQYIDGYKVTTIGEWAFDMCQSVTSITIADGITVIEDFAFYGCRNLKTIEIPDSITKIGSAFSGCFALTSITLPDGITTIEPATFQGCCNLTEIIIPDTVTQIGDLAFENCIGLAEITLPAGLSRIGASFPGCSNLTRINYGGSKSDWLAVDRMIYWDDDTGDYTVYCCDGEVSKRESEGSMPTVPDTTEPYKHNYILNTSTMKYHIDGCSSANKISEENKSYYYGTEEELIAMGYSPCGHCDP